MDQEIIARQKKEIEYLKSILDEIKYLIVDFDDWEDRDGESVSKNLKNYFKGE